MIIYCSLSGSGGSQRLSTCSSSLTLSSLRGGRVSLLRSERGVGGGGEGRRVRLTQLDGNASQMLFDFCPFSFLPECSYMVSILTRVALVSLSVSQNAPCCKKKHSSPSSYLHSSDLNFSKTPVLKRFILLFFSFLGCEIQNLIHNFLNWLCCKSCEVMHNIWTEFSPTGIYCLVLDGLHSFCYKNSIFNGVILSDFHDVLSGFSSHRIDNISHLFHVSCLMSLKIPWSRGRIIETILSQGKQTTSA